MSLYVWGSNQLKQLNNQRELHCYAPTYIPSTCGDNVPTAVAAGDSHTLVLCESGDIYSFGRGREGQLGHGSSDCSEAGIVTGLGEETIVDIAAGCNTSYAITSTGNVYQWGQVHRKINNVTRDHGLHGLAQDQDNIYIEADMEARQHELETAENGGATNTVGANGVSVSSPEVRHLRDIVRDSSERWQLPTAEADLEYLEELRASGFQPEELKARMAERRREYAEMFAVGCMRVHQYVPQKIPRLDHVRVKAVSAGFGHVMLLSDDGRLYGAGYNDRGQLGLGHRINTSEFKPLDILANKFVVQVACGQQHSICRAVPRDSPLLQDGEVGVGSDCGADAYVWGNGTLGQLGLGRKGVTKGRLFPTRNDTLYGLYPQGIVSVSAGGNFTAAVTYAGSVYSFGHSEYNQHGDNTGSNRDYIDAKHYFTPRRVSIVKSPATSSKGKDGKWSKVGAAVPPTQMQDVRIKSISCGASFTVAVDDCGDLYSWGWNESGVLGHGVRHFASTPQRVETIGAHFDGCRVRAVAAGSKHVVALTEAQGHAWASSFHSVLESEKHVDCIIEVGEAVEGTLAAKFASSKGQKNAAGQSVFPCHRAILSARSTFLRGYINAALRNQEKQTAPGVEGSEQRTDHSAVLHLSLPSLHANSVTVRSLLDYLYLDRIQVPTHKRDELIGLAKDLGVDRLHQILTRERQGLQIGKTDFPSCFTANMAGLLNTPAHADVVFVVPKEEATQSSVAAEKATAAAEETKLPVFDPTDFAFVMYAHRAVISSRLPYFEAMLTSGFAESHSRVRICAPFGGPQSVAALVDVSGLVDEGIELPVLEMVLLYAYTGQFRANGGKGGDSTFEEVDLNEVMAVLVAANRLGFTALMQYCERLLSLHLGDYFPHNAQNCLEFATAYNIPRLERQCREILKKAPGARAGSAGAGVAGNVGSAFAVASLKEGGVV